MVVFLIVIYILTILVWGIALYLVTKYEPKEEPCPMTVGDIILIPLIIWILFMPIFNSIMLIMFINDHSDVVIEDKSSSNKVLNMEEELLQAYRVDDIDKIAELEEKLNKK